MYIMYRMLYNVVQLRHLFDPRCFNLFLPRKRGEERTMGVLERAQPLLHWYFLRAQRVSFSKMCARSKKSLLPIMALHKKKFFLSCRLHDTILVSLKSSCCGEKLRIRRPAHSQDLRSRRSRNRGVQNTCSNWQRYRKMVFNFARFCWVCRIIWKYCHFGTTLTVSICVLNWIFKIFVCKKSECTWMPRN